MEQSANFVFEIPADYLVAYGVTNLVGFLLFLGALWRPNLTRVAFGLMFVAAAAVNTHMAVQVPGDYVSYGQFALMEVYRDYIHGPFADHVAAVVLPIAVGQATVGILLLVGRTAWVGAVGAAIFFVAIAPLGVGSGFPFSVTAVLALITMEWRLRHQTPEDMERERIYEQQRRLPLV